MLKSLAAAFVICIAVVHCDVGCLAGDCDQHFAEKTSSPAAPCHRQSETGRSESQKSQGDHCQHSQLIGSVSVKAVQFLTDTANEFQDFQTSHATAFLALVQIFDKVDAASPPSNLSFAPLRI
jgi:hypothetical protein